MTKVTGRLGRAEQDSLFPEFRTEEEREAPVEDSAGIRGEHRRREPAIFSVMARLAQLLSEETAAIRAGDFETFAELQRQKSALVRQAERLEHNPSALEAAEALDPEALKAKLESFNTTVETNMRTIGAVSDAIGHVRQQAIRKLEEEKGDGVYSKDGEKKSLHRLSLNDTQVKL